MPNSQGACDKEQENSVVAWHMVEKIIQNLCSPRI